MDQEPGDVDQKSVSSKLVVLSGTPFAGKSRLLWRFLNDHDYSAFKSVPRWTTRPKRPHEDLYPKYTFADDHAFNKARAAGRFLVVEKNFGYYYGVELRAFKHTVANNSPAIVIASARQGYGALQKYSPRSLFVFVTPLPITEGYTYDVDRLRELFIERVTARGCTSDIQTLLDYCESEAAALRTLSDPCIIHNEPGEEGFEKAYLALTSVIRRYLSE